jgi:hypothetical protein
MQQNFIWWAKWFINNLLRLMIRSSKNLLRLMTNYPNRIYFEPIGLGILFTFSSFFFAYMFTLVYVAIRF